MLKLKKLQQLSLIVISLCVLLLGNINFSFANTSNLFELSSNIPENASAVLFINYSNNDFYKKLIDILNRFASAEDKLNTDLLKKKVGIDFNTPIFLSALKSVALIYFDELCDIKEIGGEKVPAGLIVKMANKDAFMVHLQNFKAAMSANTSDNEYALYELKTPNFNAEVIAKKDKTEYFAFIIKDDILIGGFGSKTAVSAISKILDVLNNKQDNLSNNTSFKNAISQYNKDYLLSLYVSGDYIKTYSANNNIYQNLDFIKCFLLNITYEKNNFLVEGGLFTDKENKNNVFTKYFSNEGIKFDAPSILSNDTMLYLGGKITLDPKIIKDKVLDDVKAKIKQDLNVDFENEIMPWFNDEYFFSVSNYKVLPTPVMPPPKVYFGIKFKDKELCEKSILKIISALKIGEPKKLNVANLDYYFISLPTPNNVMPEFGLSIMFINNFLVFATSKDSINPLISAKNLPSNSLSKMESFTSNLGQLIDSSIFVVFLNNNLFSDFLISLFNIYDYKTTQAENDLLKSISNLALGFTFKDATLTFRANINVNEEIGSKILNPNWLKEINKE